MKKLILVLLFSTAFTLHADTPHKKSTLQQLSRSCIKIWCLMRNLVDDAQGTGNIATDNQEQVVDHLDTLLCKIVRVRDMIPCVDLKTSSDIRGMVNYVDSSLDCIGQYTYDLVEQYPGSWSTVIQEQVMRAQEAYAQSVLQQITR